MNAKQVVIRCCICGREKTDQGWQYAFRANESNSICSHGFCAACYDLEVMKAKLRLTLPAVAVLR